MFNIFKKKQAEYNFYIIDDEKDILEILEVLIGSTFSCNIKTFASTKDALETLRTEVIAPDLIYSDIRMGKQSGLCIKEKLEEIGNKIPILFITGLVGEEGFHNGYWSINKPVSIVSLKKYTLKLLQPS